MSGSDALATKVNGTGPFKLDKWTRALTDTTFAGIHQLDWFDYLLLIPYFTLLTILAIYGAHRFAVVSDSPKQRRRTPPACSRSLSMAASRSSRPQATTRRSGCPC